jgi:hypothetical protein
MKKKKLCSQERSVLQFEESLVFLNGRTRSSRICKTSGNKVLGNLIKNETFLALFFLKLKDYSCNIDITKITKIKSQRVINKNVYLGAAFLNCAKIFNPRKPVQM